MYRGVVTICIVGGNYKTWKVICAGVSFRSEILKY